MNDTTHSARHKDEQYQEVLDRFNNAKDYDTEQDTERMEQDIAAIKELLTVGGTDDLGRWMKALQDTEATYKAEKAAADARMKSTQKSIEYVKGLIRMVMETLGEEKVKGTFYSFALSESVKSSVNTDKLNEDWLAKVICAAHEVGLPDCIGVELKATTTRLKEAGEEFEQYINVETAPSVRFGKPRAAKE